MREQPLIIVGASARAAAFSALRAGFRPWCFDLFADADLKARCPVTRIDFRSYPNDFARLTREAPSGPWIYTGGLENHPNLIDRMAAQRLLWGNGGDVLRAVRDPLRLFRAFRDAHVPCPETRPHAPPAGSRMRWLEKPLAGAGGNGIRYWPPADARKSRRTYFQQFIPGQSAAATFVGIEGRATLLGVTRQLVGEHWLNAQPFHYCGSVGPLPMSDGLCRGFQRIGQVLTRDFGLRGLFGVDAIVRDDVPYPVEVNPRYTASMEVLEFATRVNLFDWHRHSFETYSDSFTFCTRASQQLPAASPRIVGKGVLFASKPFEFLGVKQSQSALHSSTPSPVDEGDRALSHIPTFADLPEAGTPIQAGWPVLTCFAEADSIDQVIDRLRAITSSVVCK